MTCELPKEMRRAIGTYVGCLRGSGRTGLPSQYERTECYTKLKDAMDRTRMASFIGSGVHRAAFSFKDVKNSNCVVKVAVGRYGGLSGRDANLSEAGMWRSLSSSRKKQFWPVNHSDTRGWFVTGPEVEVGAQDEDIWMLEEKTGCEDLHYQNVGYYQGRPIVLDSGFEGSGCPAGLPSPKSPSFRQWRIPLPKYAMRRAKRVVP